MTRDEITRMARESGFVGMDGSHGALGRFSALVTAAEREECAKVCDAQHDAARTSPGAARANACAEAIRARGEKGQS